MLPSHSNAGELLNVVENHTECIDNDCDTSDDDDEEDNDFRKYHRSAPVDGRSGGNVAISLVKTLPSTMTGPPKVDSLAARRPQALNLKPIVTSGEECALNLNFDDGKETSEVDGRTRADTHKRITIAFNNIKYTTRGRLFWKRGKHSLHLSLKTNCMASTSAWQNDGGVEGVSENLGDFLQKMEYELGNTNT